MKRSNSEQCIVTTNIFNEDEIEVVSILIDLQNLVSEITESRSRCRFSALIWGFKKKRSNRGSSGFSSLRCSSPQIAVNGNEIEPTPMKVKAEATSPSTPLSFSPSESDHKSKHSSRKSYKRKTREQLMETITGLSQCKELLKGEVENVRNYYNIQKAYNLRLKSMKEQVTRMLNMQGPGLNLGQQHITSRMEPNHQQPFIMDQVASGSESFHGFQYPLGQMQQSQPLFHGLVSRMGPLGIPDLNVTAEETFTVDSASPFDVNRTIAEKKAEFAEARRRRMIRRIEMKNSSGLIRIPRRR